jgi:thiol-disulfide isomerase/thioredoxin
MNIYLKASMVTLMSAAVLFAGFSYWKKSTNTEADRPSLSLIEEMETKGVPAFSLKTLDGKDFKLEDLKGQAAIVSFWASWCGPCLEEFPSMIQLVKSMDHRLKLIAIAQDNEKAEVEAFLKVFPESKQDSIVILWDKDHEAAKAYAVDRLPETFVIGKDHKLARKITGSINWNSPEAVSFMKALLEK